MTGIARYREPVAGEWPGEDLENLGACPVCGAKERDVAYRGLKDKTFFCAPGTWTMWRCQACSVAYLDPRPSLASISRAYGSYYTHAATKKSLVERALFAVQIGIRHSYLNRTFGYHLRNGLPFGWLAYLLLPSQALVTGETIRHLPSPGQENKRLLDIGCGSGEFLQTARALGYEAEGLESDPAARATAVAAGNKVHLGHMPGSGLPPSSFDQITLCHVVEHFHDPRAALSEVLALLRSGGRVWIQVPNISALSLSRFGLNSRLLEPPRHLVMFDTRSLKTLLEEVGFGDVELLETPNFSNYNNIVATSWMIEQGIDPHHTPPSSIPRDVKQAGLALFRGSERKAESAEFITMIGTKP